MRPDSKHWLRFRPMLLLSLAAIAGCGGSTGPDDPDDPDGQDGPARSVSGTVTLDPTLVSEVVLVVELEDGFASSGDKVTTIAGAAAITNPLTLAAGSASRTYEYQLPEDPATFGFLVAFIDLDGNGIPDPSTEPVRLALKQIEGVERAISVWNWASFGNNPREYQVAYADANAQWSIDLIGTTGFNFSFPVTPTPVDLAYVTHPGSVEVIDLATNTPVASIPIENDPRGIAITPDRAFAYVASVNSGFADPSTVTVIDLATNSVAGTVVAGAAPTSVAIRPDGAFGYVTNSTVSGTVSVIDLATNVTIDAVTVGRFPGGIAITPDGAFAYVTNGGDANVSVIDLTTNTVTATVAVGTAPAGIAITPDGAFAYVRNNSSDDVSVIDLATNTVTATVAVGSANVGFFVGSGIAIRPDGAFAYVTNVDSDNVSVIDLATNTVTATVAVGVEPKGIAITPDGALAYVANNQSPFPSTLSVIDLATNTVTATIVLPQCCPFEIAIR